MKGVSPNGPVFPDKRLSMNEQYSIYLQRERLDLVGTLRLNNVRGRVSSVFTYDPQWLSAPGAFALSPDLSLDQYPKACSGLFLCFQDCSPDRWGRVLLQRQERLAAAAEGRTPRALLESDFLLRVADHTRQGALRISADGGKTFLAESGPDSVPPLVYLPKLLHAAQRVSKQTESADELRLLVEPGSSLGGARPKASVLGTNGELYIAKFPKQEDERDIPLWEYVTYQLAHKAGLKAPEVQLHHIAGKNVLLVRRFDRTCGLQEGQQVTGRIPFLSAMSLLQAEDGDHSSYADIAAVLQAEGAAPRDDLQELWSRMVFNMCVYNVDDHLRNHGFLREVSGWRLSPVYDLETSHPGEKSAMLHTALIDEECDLNVNTAVEIAEFFRLRTSEAQQRLAQIREAVSSWRQEALKVGARAAEVQVMKDAYEYCL